MTRRGALTAVLLGLAAGCGSSVPAPRLTAVTPAVSAEGQAADITLLGDGLLAAVVTDFQQAKASTVDGAVRAELVSGAGEAIALEAVTLVDARTVTARVPASAPRGLYDVRVVDARGGEATLTGAFSVVTPAESVAAFSVEPIASQYAGVPFPVRVLAVDAAGQLVESFAGDATVTDDTGTLTSPAPLTFVRGRLVAFVTVPGLATGDVLHATDALGHTGDSAPFDVTAGPASRLLFAPAPLQVAVCGGPLSVSLEDAFGFPANTPADEVVALASVPAGAVAFFSDAACATPASSVTLSTGTQSATVYAQATQVGAVQLRASPATLPTAQATVTVSPQPPRALTMTATAQPLRAGLCSPPLDVQAEDALGHPSPPAAATPVSLSVTPVAAALLFSDATCTTALGALVLDAARPSARVHLLAADAGTFRLEAVAASVADAGVALTPASVDVEVLP